jgi:predicted phosphodiesterase
MTTFTWLHLSDLHLRGNETSVDRGRFEDMLFDINVQQEEIGLQPDAVFFTGDIAFSGQKDQYDQASKWLDKVLEACGLQGRRDRMFIVPGNHDVDRGEVTRLHHRQVLNDDLVKRLLEGDDYGEVDDFLGLRSSEERQIAFAKLENYAHFTSGFFSDDKNKFSYDRYYSVHAIEKNGYTVAIVGLNTAWLSFQDNEQGRLLLGEIQVCDALEEVRDKWPYARLCIALVHHPLYWLAEKDIHRVQQHLPGKCHVLLRGHLHCPSFTVQSTPDSHLYEFAAGASLRAEYHAYDLVRLDLDTGEGIAIVRLQHPKLGGKWGADDFTYRNTKGKLLFTLPLSGK